MPSLLVHDRKSSRCRGRRGLKGAGLKHQHKAWRTSGCRKQGRPGCARNWGAERVPGRDVHPGVPAGTASGSASPGASPGVAPRLLGQPGEGPSARQLLSPRLHRGVYVLTSPAITRVKYTNMRKCEEVRTGNQCPRLPAVLSSTAFSLVRGQSPEPACIQAFHRVAQEREQGGEQGGQCPASQRLLSSQTPTRWLRAGLSQLCCPAGWWILESSPGTGLSRSLVKCLMDVVRQGGPGAPRVQLWDPDRRCSGNR